MKVLLIFTLSMCVGAALFLGLDWYRAAARTEEVKLSPVAPTGFSIESPPSKSLRGTMSALSGNVLWQSRVATEGAQITVERPIQQGEQIITKENGSVEIDFKQITHVTVLHDSVIDFVQTLPSHMVFSQSQGTVSYENSGKNPVSVRAMHVLIELHSGTMQVAIQENRPLVVVSVKNGTARVGYNDLYYNSTTLDLTKGQVFYFNDETRKTDVE